MEMKRITQENDSVFRKLLTDYYRDGEDADTPQADLDRFIGVLYELCQSGTICGCIAYEGSPVGFVLWGMDGEDFPFSNKPGYGTILEIGVVPEMRGSGLGKKLVQYAEDALNCHKMYVCAYGPAEGFWENCGYRDRGEIGTNGLKILEKETKWGSMRTL